MQLNPEASKKSKEDFERLRFDVAKEELERLERFCFCLCKTLWMTRQLLCQISAEEPEALANFTTTNGTTTGTLMQLCNYAFIALVNQSLVVEEQPPQVMRTACRYKAKVRFLCGSALEGHHTVKVSNFS